MIRRALRYYIWPKCSSNVDSTHHVEPRRATLATRQSLRDKVDEFLKPGGYRHLLILADSGTGKTSFLLNYFAHNLKRRRSKRHQIQLIHLGSPDCDIRLKEIEDRKNTIIFLDALDEDLKAINKGHRARIDELMKLCEGFSHVVITCRTQFFPRGEEIPKTTGIARLGERALNESRTYEFWRLYLSPLDDSEVHEYLHRRYSFWQRDKREKAFELASKIPDLCARPMLMAHVPEIVETNQDVNSMSELYGVMVDGWIKRETDWVNKQALRDFSERLACDIYNNREERGGERISRKQLIERAKEWKVQLPDWQLTGRSLLNLDAEDNYKFAHRSILEYLVAKAIVEGRPIDGSVSDVVQKFICEMAGFDSAFDYVISPSGAPTLFRVIETEKGGLLLDHDDHPFVYVCDGLEGLHWRRLDKEMPHSRLVHACLTPEGEKTFNDKCQKFLEQNPDLQRQLLNRLARTNTYLPNSLDDMRHVQQRPHDSNLTDVSDFLESLTELRKRLDEMEDVDILEWMQNLPETPKSSGAAARQQILCKQLLKHDIDEQFGMVLRTSWLELRNLAPSDNFSLQPKGFIVATPEGADSTTLLGPDAWRKVDGNIDGNTSVSAINTRADESSAPTKPKSRDRKRTSNEHRP